ncbi:MAG: hypothetical protein VB858_06325, partial [Planctomycetaceae bacterium]
MLLLNWLQRWRNREHDRPALHTVRGTLRNPARQAVERLEPRLVLNGVSHLASVEWFGNIDAVHTSPGGLTGSGTGSGDSLAVRDYLVRLNPDATRQAGSLAGAQALVAHPFVDLSVTGGLGLPGQVVISTTERDSARVVRALTDNTAIA